MALKAVFSKKDVFMLLLTGFGKSFVKDHEALRFATGQLCAANVGLCTNKKPQAIDNRLKVQ